MKIYDTNYGPDTFGRIRMGLIKEMFLTFEGYIKPEVGDHLRISCLFKGVVRDVYIVEICHVANCVDESETVLIQIRVPTQKMSLSKPDLSLISNDMYKMHHLH